MLLAEVIVRHGHEEVQLVGHIENGHFVGDRGSNAERKPRACHFLAQIGHEKPEVHPLLVGVGVFPVDIDAIVSALDGPGGHVAGELAARVRVGHGLGHGFIHVGKSGQQQGFGICRLVQALDFLQRIVRYCLRISSSGPLVLDIAFGTHRVGEMNDIREQFEMLGGEVHGLLGIAPALHPARTIVGHNAVGKGVNAANHTLLKRLGTFEFGLHCAAIGQFCGGAAGVDEVAALRAAG